MDSEKRYTGFLTWEGEPIYEGDVLVSNDNSRGVVELVYGEYYWRKDDGDAPGTLSLIEKLSPKKGYTLLHKEIPTKDGTFDSVCRDEKLLRKAALLSESLNSKTKIDTYTGTFSNLLTFLMENNVYVTVVPTIVTEFANRKFNCFRNYEYTIITLCEYFQSTKDDGFDTWEDAAIAGINKAIDKLSEYKIKEVCDEHFK